METDTATTSYWYTRQLETVWWDCLSWWVHTPDYTNKDLHFSGPQPVSLSRPVLCHTRSTDVPHTALHSACKQPHNRKTLGQTRNRDLNYQSLRKSLHEGFKSLPGSTSVSRSSHFSPLLRQKLWLMQNTQGKKNLQETLHCTSKSYIFCHGLFRIEKNLLFGIN